MKNGLRAIAVAAVPLAVLELLNLALALALLPYLMRVLGSASFGRYAFGVAMCALLALVVDWGFNAPGASAVARAPDAGSSRATIFWTVQSGKLLLALLALPSLWLAAAATGLQGPYGSVLPVLGVAAMSALLFPQWYLQGALRLRTIAAATAVARCASTVAIVLFVRDARDAPLAVALQAVNGAVAGLLALLDRRYRQSVRWQRPRLREVMHGLRESRLLFLSTLASSVYSTTLPLVLAALTSPTTLGLYSAGDRIRAALQALLGPVSMAAFPHFSRWLHEDRQRGFAAARRLLHLQVALALAASLLVAIAVGPLLERFVGPGYAGAVPAMQLLALCTVCAAVSNTLGVQVMLALGQQRAYAAIVTGGAASGLLAVAWCGPRWGATGAAGAVLMAEAGVAWVMLWWVRHQGLWRAPA